MKSSRERIRRPPATLQNLIKRSGRLEVKLALDIATQVAAGLAAVHKKKLVHRDIKPSNIMVSFEEVDQFLGPDESARGEKLHSGIAKVS